MFSAAQYGAPFIQMVTWRHVLVVTLVNVWRMSKTVQYATMYKKESRAVAGRTAWCRCKFRYVIMAARQLAGRRPLYFTADVSIIILTYFLFFFVAYSQTSGPSPNFATCSILTVIFKIQSEIWGVPPQKFGGPKNIKISLFAIWSRIYPDWNKISSNGKWRWKLQSLPYMSTKFCELRSTNGET